MKEQDIRHENSKSTFAPITPDDNQSKEAQEALQELNALLMRIGTAMFTTSENTHTLRSRPMALQAFDQEEGVLWFFTNQHTPKVDEVSNFEYVNLNFSDPNEQTFVSISGVAELEFDRKKMLELWKPELKPWFPNGLDDPEISLLKVSIDKAEYWDVPRNRMKQLHGVFNNIASSGRPIQNQRNPRDEHGLNGKKIVRH